MKDLMNQDRALSLGLAKAVINIIVLAFAVTALAVILLGISTLIGGNLLPGLVQIFGGLALLLAIYMLLRLLVEVLMSSHRLNDRVGVLSEALREDRQSSSKAS